MTTTPGDVVRAVATGVSRLVAGGLTPAEREAELDRLADLYADETDVRHPFAVPGTPWATPLRSRADLRNHFSAVPEAERWEPVDTVVHTTGDPEVVVVETAYAATVGGRSFRLPMILVARVRDGRIVSSRDYADHAAMARGTTGTTDTAA